MMLYIGGCTLVRTCYACPEQYDVYLGYFDRGVDLEGLPTFGYLRLRHGRFSAYYRDVGGDCVYTAYPKGDGIFENDEREFHLENAVTLLIKYHNTLEIKQSDNQY